MRKSILLATAAAIALNVSAPAFASTDYSWADTIAKSVAYEAKTGRKGGWVRGEHTTKSFKAFNGKSGYLFGNVLGKDAILPLISDVSVISEAAKTSSRPIVVTSGELVLPSNSLLCAAAGQSGMECGEFTKLFYINSTLDADGNVDPIGAITRLQELQSDVMIYVSSLNLNLSPDNAMFIKSLNDYMVVLNVDPVANATLISGLEAQIATLEANSVISEESLAALNLEIDSKINFQEALLAAGDEVIASADYNNALDTMTDLQSKLTLVNDRLSAGQVQANLAIDGLTAQKDALQVEIVSLDESLDLSAYNIKLTQVNNDLKIAQDSAISWETSSRSFEAQLELADSTLVTINEIINEDSNQLVSYAEIASQVEALSNSVETLENAIAIAKFASDESQATLNAAVDAHNIAVEEHNAALKAEYAAGHAAGVASVDTQSFFNAGVNSVDLAGEYQAGINSVDTQAYFNDGVNSVDTSIYTTEITDLKTKVSSLETQLGNVDVSGTYSEGFNAGVASVNTQSFFDAGVASVDIVAEYAAGHAAGVASVDLIAEFQAGVDSVDLVAEFQAGVDSVDTDSFYDLGYDAGSSDSYTLGYNNGKAFGLANGYNSENLSINLGISNSGDIVFTGFINGEFVNETFTSVPGSSYDAGYDLGYDAGLADGDTFSQQDFIDDIIADQYAKIGVSQSGEIGLALYDKSDDSYISYTVLNQTNQFSYDDGYAAGLLAAGGNYASGHADGFNTGYTDGVNSVDTDSFYDLGYDAGLLAGGGEGYSVTDLQIGVSLYKDGTIKYHADDNDVTGTFITQAVYASYDTGYDLGFTEGKSAGYNDGHNVGYAAGLNDGGGEGYTKPELQAFLDLDKNGDIHYAPVFGENGTYITNLGYHSYDTGYDKGYDNGLDDGFDDTIDYLKDNLLSTKTGKVLYLNKGGTYSSLGNIPDSFNKGYDEALKQIHSSITLSKTGVIQYQEAIQGVLTNVKLGETQINSWYNGYDKGKQVGWNKGYAKGYADASQGLPSNNTPDHTYDD